MREGWGREQSIRLDALMHLKLEESFSKIAIVAIHSGKLAINALLLNGERKKTYNAAYLRLISITSGRYCLALCASPVVRSGEGKQKCVPPARRGQFSSSGRGVARMAINFCEEITPERIVPKVVDVRLCRCQVFSDARTRRD